MNKKFFTFLFFCLLSLFANNAYAWREVNPCVGNLTAQCSYYVTNVKIGTLSLDTQKTVTAQDSDKLWGEINSNQNVDIAWALTSKPNNIPTKAPTGYFYIVNYKCSNLLSDLTSDLYGYHLINQVSASQLSSQNTSFQIPEKAENIAGCSDKTKACYCRIAWQLFDSKKVLKAGSLTQPFVIKNNSGSSVKLYNPPSFAVEGVDYQPNATLLKFKTNFNVSNLSSGQIQTYFNKYNLKYVDKAGFVNIVRVESSEKNVKDIMKLLQNDGMIEYIEPNYYMKDQYIPNDPVFKEQYSLNNTSNEFIIRTQKDITVPSKIDADMDVVEAWDKYNPTQDIVVAVVDSGFSNYLYPDINYWDGNSCWSPDGSGRCPNHGWDTWGNDNNIGGGVVSHGLQTASIIGAVTDNNIGMSGMSSKNRIKVMLIKAGRDKVASDDIPKDPNDEKGIIDMKSIDGMATIKGIEFAMKNNAKIINASFGAYIKNETMERAINEYTKQGGLFVTSAGNNGKRFGEPIKIPITYNQDGSVKEEKLIPLHQYPCEFNDKALLCVSSTNEEDKHALHSNYGNSVDISAPGEDILVIYDYDQSKKAVMYVYGTGTSFASPNAAGVAGMVWSQRTNLSNVELANLIKQNGDSLSDLQGKTETGKRVNAYKALTGESLSDNDNTTTTPPDNTTTTPPIDDFKIIYPNGGEEFKTDDEVEIKWSTGKNIDAKIMLTLIDYQSGDPKHIVVSPDEDNDGSYKFKITDSMLEKISGSSKKGDKYKIGGVLYSFKTANINLQNIYINVLASSLAKDAGIGPASDTSDDYFSINMDSDDDDDPPPPPEEDYIKVIYPNGGEKFKTGDKVKVTWEAKIPNYTDPYIPFFIEICDWNRPRPFPYNCRGVIDNNQPLVDGYAKNNERSYEFVLTDAIIKEISHNNNNKGDKYKVRVGLMLPTYKKEIEDISDNYFSINMDTQDDDEGDHSIEKPLVISESIDVYNSKLRFRATVYVGKKPADVEYWFESYQRDESGSPVSGTEERTPNPNGQMKTGPSMNHLFTGFRNNYISGKVYCFTPYAKFKGANDVDAGFGAEICFPNVPWVITLPATNWQESKATINGAITYFAKNPNLTAYFKYYVKGDEENVKETIGKSYSKPTSGPEKTPFSEPFTIPDVMKEYCYRACAKVPSNSKIFGCGAEWCFPVQSTSTDDLIVKNEKFETEDGSATTFYGYIENFDKAVWGIPTSKIVPGFKVYPKGEWAPNSDKNIDIKWLGPQNQSSFTVNASKKVANFSIYTEGMDFKSSSYCFRAYAIDKVNKKTVYAENEICGDKSKDDEEKKDDEKNNEEGNDRTNCSVVQLGASTCPICPILKPVFANIAKRYNTTLDESIDSQTKYDSDIIGNKTGKTKFFYVDISQVYPKDLKSLQSKYNLQEGVPRILVYKDGKDVILSRVSFFSEVGFDENQIIDSTIKQYCGNPYK